MLENFSRSHGSGNGSGSKAWVYVNSKWSFAVNGLYQIAPVSNNLIQAFVGQHVLGLPRSY